MKRVRLLLMLITIALAQTSFGQRLITGNIVDENNEPLIGVTVIVPGTNIGTVTNFDGEFSIELAEKDSLLQVSFIGYSTEIIDITNKAKVDVQLIPDMQAIGEVVVIGYGTTRKKDLTSSIAIVDNEEVAKVPVTSFEQALQGKTAGVTVVQSGSPDGSASVRIRGTGSINGSEPLYVVDGIIGAPAPAQDNVESIQILKDAASCAIYGSRGANGVIIVTTKKGKKGAPKVSVKSYYGWQNVTNKLELLDADGFIKFWETNLAIDQMIDDETGEQLYPNGAGGAHPLRVDSALINPDDYYRNTDWQDEIFKTGYISTINANISSANDNIAYFLGVDHKDNSGTQINGGYKETSFQLNSSYKTDFLKIEGIDFEVGENVRYLMKNAGDNGSRLRYALRQSPLLPVYNEDAQGDKDRFAGNTTLDNSNNPNPVGDLYAYNRNSRTDGFYGNFYTEFSFFSDLKLRANYNLIVENGGDFNVSYPRIEGNTGPNKPNISASQSSWRTVKKQIESTLTYTKSINYHNISAMAGYTQEEEESRWHNGQADNFGIDDPRSLGSRTDDSKMNINGSYSEFAMQSFLGRIMYNYNGKYLFTANVRSDGTSNFQEGKRFNTFPSVSGGWRISDEEFMSEFDWLNTLKARFGFGQIGRREGVSGANQISLLGSTPYIFNNQVANGVTPSSLIDPDLTWERVTTTGLGLDVEALNNKIKFSFDYYKNVNNNMILKVPIPYSAGLRYTESYIISNLGHLDNSGFEITASNHKYNGDFNYDIIGTLTIENTEVTDLGKTTNIPAGKTQYYEYLTRTAVGTGIGDFYGYVFDGIYQIGDTDIPVNRQPGDVRYRDINGDGVISNQDYTYLGSPVPDFTYSITTNFSYKGLDLSMFFYGVYGNEIFNHNRFHTESFSKSFNQGVAALNAWTPSNPSNEYPRYTDNHTGNVQVPSSRFVEDGSYFRLQNITLGYTFPERIIQEYNIDGLRVYATAQNLFTLTKYSGMDPEISGGGTLARGIDDSNYPMARTIALGIEFRF